MTNHLVHFYNVRALFLSTFPNTIPIPLTHPKMVQYKTMSNWTPLEKRLPRIEVFSKGYLLDANNYGEPFLQKKARHQRDSKPPHCRGVFIIEVLISRCPSMRASNYSKFGVFGTKRTVMGASVLWTCLYPERFNGSAEGWHSVTFKCEFPVQGESYALSPQLSFLVR